MLSQLLQPEIRALIDERNLSTLKEVLSDWTPASVNFQSELPEQEQVLVFRLLPDELAADTFEYLDIDMQVSLLKAMGKEEASSILNEMSPDDRTALFEDLPGVAAKQLITLLSSEERKIATTLLGYPEDSVGRLMTPDYIAVKPEWTMTEVLNYIRENGKDSETLNIIYVIDNKGKLIDDIRIRDIILSPVSNVVLDLMDENFVALHVNDDGNCR
jgi:magnesium transporter